MQATLTQRRTRSGTIAGRVTKPNARRLANISLSKTPLKSIKSIPIPPACTDHEPSTCIPMSPISQLSHQDPVETSVPLPPEPSQLSLSFQPDGPVVGRQDEFDHLFQLVSEAMRPSAPSKSIYVCGTPGTGKTYAVSKVAKTLSNPFPDEVECLSDSESISTSPTSHPRGAIFVNCATLSQPKDLYVHLASELGVSASSINAAQDAIRSYATTPGPKVLVVLDEVDFLTSSDQMVLYAAFEWPRLPNSRLVIIGIANAIDLPVRLLPWLRASGGMPDIVPFTPYDACALTAIVQQRLGVETDSLSEKAISLAAKKIAAGSGDARLVLDVCREAMLEMGRGVKKNSIMVVSTIINKRGGLSAAVETIKRLPVQQQLALCVAANAALLVSSGVSGRGGGGRAQTKKKTTLGGLFDSFVRMCNRARVCSVSFSEFADICCNSLVHHGLLDVPAVSAKAKKGARTLRSKPIRLRVPVEDVRAGVADRGFLPLLVVK